MNAIDLLKNSLGTSKQMIEWIVSDLSDADLLVRPVPSANHFAWQLGHLIVAERSILLEQVPQAAVTALPDGFAERHGKEAATSDSAAAFQSKDQYLALFGQVRNSTMTALSSLTEADLDRATVGNLAAFFPTLGSIFGMFSDHIYMHLGQATVLRRKLGKPVLF
jgi:DinB superfamily